MERWTPLNPLCEIYRIFINIWNYLIINLYFFLHSTYRFKFLAYGLWHRLSKTREGPTTTGGWGGTDVIVMKSIAVGFWLLDRRFLQLVGEPKKICRYIIKQDVLSVGDALIRAHLELVKEERPKVPWFSFFETSRSAPCKGGIAKWASKVDFEIVNNVNIHIDFAARFALQHNLLSLDWWR